MKIFKIKIKNFNLTVGLFVHERLTYNAEHLSCCLKSENKAASDYLHLSSYSLDPTAKMFHARKIFQLIQNLGPS